MIWAPERACGVETEMRNSFLFAAGLVCALAVAALVTPRKTQAKPAALQGADRGGVVRRYGPRSAAGLHFAAQDFYDR